MELLGEETHSLESRWQVLISLLLILLLNWQYQQQMQPSTPISSYKHHQQSESPPLPTILRSKQKIALPEDDPLRRIKEFVHQPQEIIIDARKYNQEHPSKRDRPSLTEGIRSEIDACLTAVAKVYEEQSRRRSRHVLAPQTNVHNNDPIISNNSIHRVDTNLILKYIGTINQDYGLPNRFGALKTTLLSHKPQITQPVAKNPEERFTSTEKARGKSRRSFINLTLSTNRQKREDSTAKQKFKESTHHRLSPSTNNSPNRTLYMVSNAHPHNASGPQIQEKISQEFKYCISCQLAVLARNIDYHQKYECKELEGLYRMSFKQLKELIYKKITRMREQIKEKVNRLRSIQQQHESEFPSADLKGQVCEKVLKSIEVYLQSSSQEERLGSEELQVQYSHFRESLRNDFLECIGLTQKLDYFIKVYVKLGEQSPLPLTLSHQNSFEFIRQNSRPIKTELSISGQEIMAEQEYKISLNPISPFQPGQ